MHKIFVIVFNLDYSVIYSVNRDRGRHEKFERIDFE